MNSDPKKLYGEAKPPLHLIPPAGNEEQAKALGLGFEFFLFLLGQPHVDLGFVG